MSGLIALNLVRNWGRTALTAAGIAIGVATIVALLGLTQGLKQSFGGLSNLGGASFGVFQAGVADPTASVLPESLVPRIRDLHGVEDVAPIQLVTEALPQSSSALVFGIQPNSLAQERLVIGEGRAPRDDEAMVGDALATSEGLQPGDTASLNGERFRIVGIYESGVTFEDSGLVVPLPAANRLSGRTGTVTTIGVAVEPTASTEAVTQELERKFPGTITIANPGEAARANPGFEIVTKAVLVIGVLAIVLGAVAVVNTMAMAVLERRRELALLAAIGWSRPQVAAIVVGEGAGVGLLGAGLGVLGGIVLSELLVSLLAAGGFVSPAVTAWAIGRGLLVGVAIGVLGGLYPAWSVSRRPPAQLLGRI